MAVFRSSNIIKYPLTRFFKGDLSSMTISCASVMSLNFSIEKYVSRRRAHTFLIFTASSVLSFSRNASGHLSVKACLALAE